MCWFWARSTVERLVDALVGGRGPGRTRCGPASALDDLRSCSEPLAMVEARRNGASRRPRAGLAGSWGAPAGWPLADIGRPAAARPLKKSALASILVGLN